MKFIKNKTLNTIALTEYLRESNKTNQFSNYGPAVRLLEAKAKLKLKIDEDKAVIATSSGTSAIHALILAITELSKVSRVITQAFTFYSNRLGPASNSIVVDINEQGGIDLNSFNTERSIIIVTNCFGIVQNIDEILLEADKYGHFVIFDNAATPYSFYKNSNACNYGFGSAISLHHTKPLGFGEGGLVIVDKRFEKYVRSAISFGIDSNSKNASNFRMSDVSAAGILQYWHDLDFDVMMGESITNYKKVVSSNSNMIQLVNYADISSYNCCPLVASYSTKISKYPGQDVKKYYKPLEYRKNSNSLYNNIICFPIMSD